MKRLALSLILALATTVATVSPTPAQATPEFRNGFETLAQLIPDIVGQPLANEQFNPQMGQATQPTTGGLLVWTKVTNTTAFTDGSTTWIIGPSGLQVRPNSVRFEWEGPDPEDLFLDVGTTRGLDIAPVLVDAAQTLQTVDGGEWLLRVAAENAVAIRSGSTPPNVLGAYFPNRNLVVISSRLNSYSSRVRAAVLAHELQHAAGAAAGDLPATPEQCINFEAEAFGREATVWSDLWDGNLPPDTNPVVAQLNDVTRTIATDPAAFTADLVQTYGADCGLAP